MNCANFFSARVAFAAGAWLSASISLPLCADISVPRVLSSHMVLQRDIPAPVWGTAAPGEKVTVSFRGQEKTTVADATGKWLVKLDPLEVGDPAELTISGNNTITLSDVLVGEVWVGSGQSNLDTDVPDYVKEDQVLAEAASKSYPQLRLFRSDVGNGWQQTTPQTLRRFSAQLFYFGMKLQQELNVPVGVMEGAVRGSPAVHWLAEEAFQSDAGIQGAIRDYDAANPMPVREEKYRKALAEWEKKYGAAPATEEAKRSKPSPPQPGGYTKGERGNHFEKHIRPMIPYAIRGVLWDQGEGGANAVGIRMPLMMEALIRAWRAEWGQGDFPFLYVQKPSGQGCALNPDDPLNKGAAPFRAELPKNPPSSDVGGWPPRFYCFEIMKIPNTYLVTASDLSTGVHPPIKSGYGARDCQVALGAVYGKPVAFYGPLYDSLRIEGDKLRIKFKHTGKGLAVPAGQKLQGFAIAGENRQFQWAEAVIEGDEVVLSSPSVPAPVAARYAWAWDISWANLFNHDGLPALSFKTDSWK